MSQFGFMIVRYVATKSAPVIGWPSLHLAVGLYVAVALSGSFWRSFGNGREELRLELDLVVVDTRRPRGSGS